MPLHGLTTSKLLLASTLGGPLSAAAANLLLDTYPNAAMAYSFRKLRTAYAGSAVRIRRSSDNAEADIGFNGTDFDTAAAATHIGGGSGFIAKWYDQSGNAKDMVQATANSQATYTASGVGSLPSASLDGSDDQWAVSMSNTDLGGETTTVLAALYPTTHGGSKALFHWSSDNILNWLTSYDTIYWDFGGAAGGRANVAKPGGWNDADHILELYRDTGDVQGIVVDGTSLKTESRTADLTATTASFELAARQTNSRWLGFIAEFVWWKADLGTTDRAGARTDMNTYYSVF